MSLSIDPIVGLLSEEQPPRPVTNKLDDPATAPEAITPFIKARREACLFENEVFSSTNIVESEFSGSYKIGSFTIEHRPCIIFLVLKLFQSQVSF
mgnify:CR=1 FL=1